MRLTFAGSGDAFGSGGRHNTCFHVEARPQSFLIDCGASALVALKALSLDLARIRTIFITHLHGDHFAGLPFFLLDGQLVHRRQSPLTIAGPAGMAERLTRAQEVLFAGSSAIEWRYELDVVELETGRPIEVNGVTVTPFEVDHPSGAPSHALRFECEGKVLCYSGDTQWTDTLLDAARGADLFICECYGAAPGAPYHLDQETLTEKLHLFDVRRFMITHMSAAMLDRSAESGFEAACDGMVVDV